MDTIDLLILVGKVLFVSILLLSTVPLMAIVERRGSALMQNRLGPNRVGPQGLLQPIADVVKFLWKEDGAPSYSVGPYFRIAPLMSLVPAMMTFAVIPLAAPLHLTSGRLIHFQVANLNVGFLYALAVASIGVYGIVLAAWCSNNKLSMLGGLRSSAQMISYELAMTLSLVTLVLLHAQVDLQGIVTAQSKTLLSIGPLSLPKWGILVAPLSFLIFLVCAFAETNRLPFDLPEGESEIVAGYHLEFGSIKFAMFMMAEYMNMLTISGLIASLFLGGYAMLPGFSFFHEALSHVLQLSLDSSEWLRVFFQVVSLVFKLALIMWFFVWVRWTLPRFRYDQLMDLGWKVLVPLSFLNLWVCVFLVYGGVL
jgi:NADH-quinone oxidoreductase subunit H